MIGIEDISYHLWSMPRLFTQMLQVLVDQMSNDVCSIHMWQVRILIFLWTSYYSLPIYNFATIAKNVTYFARASALISLQMIEIRFWRFWKTSLNQEINTFVRSQYMYLLMISIFSKFDVLLFVRIPEIKWDL